MPTPNDFWVNVCRLAESYKNAGMVEDERTENLRRQFQEIALVGRREVVDDLAWLAAHLPDLHVVVRADTLAAEREEIEARKRHSSAG